MASLFVDWKFGRLDLRIYLEWQRTTVEILLNYYRTRAQSLYPGLEKAFDLPRGKVLYFMMEHSNLVRNQAVVSRIHHYQHILVDQGYTHQGQLLGAGLVGAQ